MDILDIKQNNRKRIYAFIREQGQTTKQDIAYRLQLSLPTVTQNLVHLVELGLINRDTKMSSKAGRNPVAYSYVPDGRVAIGLDITRSHIKSVVIDLDGNIIKYVHRRRLYQRSEEYLKMLGSEVEQIIASAQLDHDKIIGVGIAVPGLIDHIQEYVVDGRVINNTGMTREEFSQYIPFPTRLIHDTDAAGFSEIIRANDLHNACYLSLGSSIGGSVFINDKVYWGEGLFSCEFGHLNMVPNGRKCYCGQNGCFDPYCNVDVLAKHAEGDLMMFFERLNNGDEHLAAIWDDYLNHLATLITEIRMMFGSMIIIGGDLGTFIDKYIPTIQAKIDLKSPFGEKSAQYLLASRNKFEAIATGAALYFAQTFLDSDLDIKEKNNQKIG